MGDKPAQRIAAAIVCLGLGYFSFEYNSVLAGIGCFCAFFACYD